MPFVELSFSSINMPTQRLDPENCSECKQAHAIFAPDNLGDLQTGGCFPVRWVSPSGEMLLPVKNSTDCRAVIVRACHPSSVGHETRLHRAPPQAEAKCSATASSRRPCLLSAVSQVDMWPFCMEKLNL